MVYFNKMDNFVYAIIFKFADKQIIFLTKYINKDQAYIDGCLYITTKTNLHG